MAELGIYYEHATPHSERYQWWFWNCYNLPKKLPPYLSILNVTPMDAIGHGLDIRTAARLTKNEN